MAQLLDMSKVPLPAAVEELDFDALRTARLERYAELMETTVGALNVNDPAVRLLEVGAYREMDVRARINDSVRNSLLAYAYGAALDDFGNEPVYDTDRLVLDAGDPSAVPPVPPTYESNDAYRARLQQAPSALSVAGPAGAYEVIARGAHPDVVDVRVTRTGPAQILVEVLHDSDDPDILTDVENALSPDDVRPFGDEVTVQAASRETSSRDITVWVPDGPDLSAVQAAAQERINKIVLPVAASVGSGALLTQGDADWAGAAMVDGVTDVETTASAGMTDPQNAWWPMTITVTAQRLP